MDGVSTAQERQACLALIEHQVTEWLLNWGFRCPHISHVDQRGRSLAVEVAVGDAADERRVITLDADRLVDPAACREQLRAAECQCRELFAPIYLLIEHHDDEVDVSLMSL